MESLNYLRKASEYLRSTLIPSLKGRGFAGDAVATEAILTIAHASEKFILPEGGRIFDDRLRGLPDKLNLPFPSIDEGRPYCKVDNTPLCYLCERNSFHVGIKYHVNRMMTFNEWLAAIDKDLECHIDHPLRHYDMTCPLCRVQYFDDSPRNNEHMPIGRSKYRGDQS